MGRQPWTSRLTVEDCLPLEVGSFRRAGVFDPPAKTVCTTGWTDAYGGWLGAIEYWVTQEQSGRLAVLIKAQYARLESLLRRLDDCLIPLTTTRPHLGGRRFWFRCPIVRDGRLCNRRVRKLHLPPGQQVFGCSDCYDLTYKSAQQHHKRKDLARDPERVMALLKALRSGLNANAAS
jgi:hypothetical protein